MKNKKRKSLKRTQREVVIGLDKTRCCNVDIRWARVYPFALFCDKCDKPIRFEDQIIFHKRKAK